MSNVDPLRSRRRSDGPSLADYDLNRLLIRGRRLQAQAMGEALRKTGRAVRAAIRSWPG